MVIDQIISTTLAIFSAIIASTSAFFIYRTIKSNETLNQKLIFNEIVKQERELRIKLNEYRKEIHKKQKKSQEFEELSLDYDTILFNYYEYLAICLYRKLINEKEVKLYFKQLIKGMKEKFDPSPLFKKDFAKKEDYPGILWLFKKWKISS